MRTLTRPSYRVSTALAALLIAALALAACSRSPSAAPSGGAFPLPYSGLAFTVAGMLEVGVTPVDPRHTLTPDVEAVLTYRDWVEGGDPALSLIIGSAP